MSLFNLKILLGSDPVPQVPDLYLDGGTEGAHGCHGMNCGNVGGRIVVALYNPPNSNYTSTHNSDLKLQTLNSESDCNSDRASVGPGRAVRIIPTNENTTLWPGLDNDRNSGQGWTTRRDDQPGGYGGSADAMHEGIAILYVG
jgi:hypothetical protein